MIEQTVEPLEEPDLEEPDFGEIEARDFLSPECVHALEAWYENFFADATGTVAPPVLLWDVAGEWHGQVIWHRELRYRLLIDPSIHPGLAETH